MRWSPARTGNRQTTERTVRYSLQSLHQRARYPINPSIRFCFRDGESFCSWIVRKPHSPSVQSSEIARTLYAWLNHLLPSQGSVAEAPVRPWFFKSKDGAQIHPKLRGVVLEPLFPRQDECSR